MPRMTTQENFAKPPPGDTRRAPEQVRGLVDGSVGRIGLFTATKDWRVLTRVSVQLSEDQTEQLKNVDASALSYNGIKEKGKNETIAVWRDIIAAHPEL